MEDKELAVITQLPKITEYFEKISEEVDLKVNRAMSLAVTEDNIQDIKKVRATLNKEFQEYEAKRKQIKEQILAPYNKFNDEYVRRISSKYNMADKSLKGKIADSENIVKKEKEEDLQDYFNDLAENMELEKIVKYEDLQIKVTLSDSMKKLMEQVKSKLEEIQRDITLIEMEEFKDEIMVEYLIDRNFIRAKMAVIKRKQEQARIKAIQEERAKAIEEDNKIIEKVEQNIVIPAEEITLTEDSNLLTTAFSVRGTKEQLIALRDYMNENKLEFKNI